VAGAYMRPSVPVWQVP